MLYTIRQAVLRKQREHSGQGGQDNVPNISGRKRSRNNPTKKPETGKSKIPKTSTDLPQDYLEVLAELVRSAQIPRSPEGLMTRYSYFPPLEGIIKTMLSQGVIEESESMPGKYRLTQEGGRFAMDTLLPFQDSSNPSIKRMQVERFGKPHTPTPPIAGSNVVRFPGVDR